MNKDANALNWFEIPVTDMQRAKNFYDKVFDINIAVDNMMGMEMGFLPFEDGNGKVSGALVKSDMHKPSMDGALVYLNANPDIQKVVDRVESAGGKVVMPKTLINEQVGYMAFFTDTEGNKMGLHASS
ncbi:VOC family protein [Taibaiella soli]|uniref:VOC family protein n=1 Tax=Taibaiella soli TaxID=1649169 RepID=A0A2W2A7S7_9BACT|nr:VOC family protein [Taibaiella soli]PZF71405.1 VOC family protein [Taibaiella soli]